MEHRSTPQALPRAGDAGLNLPPWWEMLRAIREARGVTQDGWAAWLGYSRSTVRRWERGAAAPDDLAAQAIVDHCRAHALFKTFEHGLLSGVTLTAELLNELLSEARLDSGRSGKRAVVRPLQATAEAPTSIEQPQSAEPRSSLPRPITSFVGREDDLRAVAALLADSQLVTLTGAGGVGKTRLAIETARRLAEGYPDGVWLVELAALIDPELIAQVVARTLAVHEAPGRSDEVALLERLTGRHLLLVLDNCEHLIDACARLAGRILQAGADVRVLATSREPLAVTGETVYRVPSLVVSPEDRAEPFGATRLFLDRARAVRPEFTYTAENGPAIGSICRRLDGIPLAIELVAARVSVLTPEQILARLDDRFRLLSSGERTAEPRHQTLRALIDWSHNLLSDAERTLLRRLSVFAGGWMLEAAESTCSGDRLGQKEVFGALAQLVEKSLVVGQEAGRAMRYRLPESVRQYGDEQLRASGEDEALRDRHATVYRELALVGTGELWGLDQGEVSTRLELEIDNFRAALSWWLERENGAAVLSLATALGRFWEQRGYLTEGRTWLGRSLSAGGRAPAELQAKALEIEGRLARLQGDYVTASHLLERALDLFRELGDAASVAAVLTNLGSVALRQGDYDVALRVQEESLSICRELGDDPGVAAALLNLGNVVRRQGDQRRSLALREESLRRYGAVGDPQGVALALLNLGISASDSGDADGAVTLLEQSLEQARALGDWYIISRPLIFLAGPLLARGERMRAASLCHEALVICRDRADSDGIAYCLEALAAVFADAGEGERASRLLGAAESLRERIGAPLAEVDRAIVGRAAAAARLTLGTDAFAAAELSGRSQQLADVIGEALASSPLRVDAMA